MFHQSIILQDSYQSHLVLMIAAGFRITKKMYDDGTAQRAGSICCRVYIVYESKRCLWASFEEKFLMLLPESLQYPLGKYFVDLAFNNTQNIRASPHLTNPTHQLTTPTFPQSKIAFFAMKSKQAIKRISLLLFQLDSPSRPQSPTFQIKSKQKQLDFLLKTAFQSQIKQNLKSKQLKMPNSWKPSANFIIFDCQLSVRACSQVDNLLSASLVVQVYIQVKGKDHITLPTHFISFPPKQTRFSSQFPYPGSDFQVQKAYLRPKSKFFFEN